MLLYMYSVQLHVQSPHLSAYSRDSVAMRLARRVAVAVLLTALLAVVTRADLGDLHDRLEAVMKKQRQIEDVVSRSRAVGRGINFYDVARTVAGEWQQPGSGRGSRVAPGLLDIAFW